MTVEQAAARRDFTVNAIYAKLPEGLIEDPFAGVLDLRREFYGTQPNASKKTHCVS